MKKQNFYPKQVLRAIAGKDVQSLSDSQRHALNFFLRRSRKNGTPVGVIQTSDFRSKSNEEFEATAAAILANVRTRVILKAS